MARFLLFVSLETIYIMKKTLIIALSAIMALTFTNCKKKDNGPSNTASVMFVNGCAGATSLQVTANSANVNNATNLSLFGTSGYQNVTATTTENLAFVVPGINSTLAGGSVSLIVGGHYSAFAGGLSTNGKFVFTTDDLTAPTSGMAKIRLVNLSPDNLSIALNLGPTVIDSGVASTGYTAFSNVTAGNYKITVGDNSSSLTLGSVISLTGQQLSAGKIYTLIYTGTSTGTGTGGYTLTVLTNN